MLVDNISSNEDFYGVDTKIKGSKTSGTPTAWFGRKILEAQNDRSIHSILKTSLAHRQMESRNSVTVGGREKKSISYSNSGAPSFNPSSTYGTFDPIPPRVREYFNRPPTPNTHYNYDVPPSNIQTTPPPSNTSSYSNSPSLNTNYNSPGYVPSNTQRSSSNRSSQPLYATLLPLQQGPLLTAPIIPQQTPMFATSLSAPSQSFSIPNPFLIPPPALNIPPPPISSFTSNLGNYNPPVPTSPILRSTNLEVQKPYFSSTSPIASSSQKQHSNNISTTDVADFMKGFAGGLPQGTLDSLNEIPSTISTTVKTVAKLDSLINPIVPNQESLSQITAISETISYLGTCSGSELIKVVVPDAHKLFTNWDTISFEERGRLLAYCIGKYGTDFVLLPTAAAKGVKMAGGILKEAATLGKIESAIGAAAKEAEAIETILGSSKLAKGSIPLAEQQTVGQKHLLSEELQRSLAEVIENTKITVPSKTFAEGKTVTEEINTSLKNSRLTNPEIGRNFTDIEKKLPSTALESKTITGAGLNFEALSRAGKELDRAELTRAGRSLMKHGNREGSIFPKPAGNATELNERGQIILEQILHDPKSQVFTTPEGGIKIYAPDGRGAQFRKDGSFKGFIEQQHE